MGRWTQGGGGLVEQNAKERGGSESCFVFTSWLTGPLISFSFFICPGRILKVFTKSSLGKLTEEQDIMLTVSKFYR